METNECKRPDVLQRAPIMEERKLMSVLKYGLSKAEVSKALSWSYTPRSSTFLHLIMEHGRGTYATLRHALCERPDLVHVKNDCSETPLHRLRGQPWGIELLLAAAAKRPLPADDDEDEDEDDWRQWPTVQRNAAEAFLNARDSQKYTALMSACSSGQANVALALVRLGADPLLPTFEGMTALHAVARACCGEARMSDEEIVTLLDALDAAIRSTKRMSSNDAFRLHDSKRSVWHQSPLERAVHYENVAYVQWYMARQREVDPRSLQEWWDSAGWSLLEILGRNGDDEDLEPASLARKARILKSLPAVTMEAWLWCMRFKPKATEVILQVAQEDLSLADKLPVTASPADTNALLLELAACVERLRQLEAAVPTAEDEALDDEALDEALQRFEGIDLTEIH